MADKARAAELTPLPIWSGPPPGLEAMWSQIYDRLAPLFEQLEAQLPEDVPAGLMVLVPKFGLVVLVPKKDRKLLALGAHRWSAGVLGLTCPQPPKDEEASG